MELKFVRVFKGVTIQPQSYENMRDEITLEAAPSVGETPQQVIAQLNQLADETLQERIRPVLEAMDQDYEGQHANLWRTRLRMTERVDIVEADQQTNTGEVELRATPDDDDLDEDDDLDDEDDFDEDDDFDDDPDEDDESDLSPEDPPEGLVDIEEVIPAEFFDPDDTKRIEAIHTDSL